MLASALYERLATERRLLKLTANGPTERMAFVRQTFKTNITQIHADIDAQEAGYDE